MGSYKFRVQKEVGIIFECVCFLRCGGENRKKKGDVIAIRFKTNKTTQPMQQICLKAASFRDQKKTRFKIKEKKTLLI